MEGFKITKRPKLKSPYLLVAWPGMGEVAFKAVSYLVEKLKAEEFASIPAEDFFYQTGSTVQKGLSAGRQAIVFLGRACPHHARPSVSPTIDYKRRGIPRQQNAFI